MISKFEMTIIALVILGAVAVGAAVQFVVAREEDKIVAKIAEKEVYESEIREKVKAYMELNSLDGSMNYDELDAAAKKEIISSVIVGDLILDEAKKAKIDETEKYKKTLAFAGNQLMQRSFIEKVIKENIAETKIKEKYEQMRSFINEVKADMQSKYHKDYYAKIDKADFLQVPMNFYQQDKQFLNKLVINKTKGYETEYTKGSNIFPTLFDFLISIGNDKDTSVYVAKLIERLVHNMHNLFSSFNHRTISFVSIQATNAKHLEQERLHIYPNWHTDFASVANNDGYSYKFVIALKGPQTIYVKLPNIERNKVIKILREWRQYKEQNKEQKNLPYMGLISHYILNKIHNIIETCEQKNRCSLHQGEGIDFGFIHKVGNLSKNVTIHTTPPIHSDRLFLSIK